MRMSGLMVLLMLASMFVLIACSGAVQVSGSEKLCANATASADSARRVQLKPDSSTFWVSSVGSFGMYPPYLDATMILKLRPDGWSTEEQLFLINPPVQFPEEVELDGPAGWLQKIKVGQYWHVLMKPPVKRGGKYTFVIRRKGVADGVFGMQIQVFDGSGRLTRPLAVTE